MPGRLLPVDICRRIAFVFNGSSAAVFVGDRNGLGDNLQPFVDWKTSTGYNVSVVTTDVAGTTTTAIKSYISGLYNGPNPPVYILMIGDSPGVLATFRHSLGARCVLAARKKPAMRLT